MSGATTLDRAFLLVDATRLYRDLDSRVRLFRRVHQTCEALLSDSHASDDRMTDLATLLRGCAAQDRAAFRALYDRQAARLHGIAMRITRQPALAADAVHDTFIALWQHAGSFDPARGSAEAWLTSIARYRALDIARRRTREVTGIEMPEVADPEPDALAKLTGNAEAESLRQCLEELEPDRRGLVVAAFVDGLSHTELSQQRALPLGTVKSTIRRALAALKRCLEP
jgi:RNA polymerase sigma-70 factor (ECF subfamily)